MKSQGHRAACAFRPRPQGRRPLCRFHGDRRAVEVARGWGRDENAGHAQPGMGLSPHRDLILGQTCRCPATGFHWLSSIEGEQIYLPQFNRKPLEFTVSRVCRCVSVVTLQEE